MDLNCFRDRLFDLLNDSEELGLRVWQDREWESV